MVYCETLIHTECLFTINLGPARPHTVEVATASVHPSYSHVPQVIPTSSSPLLLSVPPAQQATSQLPTALPQYPSPSSFNLSPPDTSPDTSPISPPGTVTTPPDLQPVIMHTLGMKVLYITSEFITQNCVPFYTACYYMCVHCYIQYHHYTLICKQIISFNFMLAHRTSKLWELVKHTSCL